MLPGHKNMSQCNQTSRRLIAVVGRLVGRCVWIILIR